MQLINFEVNLFLAWSSTCVIANSTGEGRFKTTDRKRFVTVVTQNSQCKITSELKSGFRRATNWNKYQSNLKTFGQNRYLNHLVNSNFEGGNRLFALSFENENDRTSHSNYYLPRVEVKGCNVMTDRKNKLINQLINSKLKTYENIWNKLLLTNSQVSDLSKAYTDKSSINIKLSKTQISKIIQSEEYTCRLLSQLQKTGLTIKNVIKSLAKSILIPLRLTAAASAADTGIH